MLFTVKFRGYVQDSAKPHIYTSEMHQFKVRSNMGDIDKHGGREGMLVSSDIINAY